MAESLRITLLVGNLGALIFGLLLIARLSALKKFEVWAERRIFSPEAIKPLEEKMYLPVDAFVRVHPRVVGALVILGSVYVLANLIFIFPG